MSALRKLVIRSMCSPVSVPVSCLDQDESLD